MSDLWVSRFEPKQLSEVVGQSELVRIFKDYAQKKFIPNMTLSGSPGIGKTLLVKLFAVELGFIKYEDGKIIDLIPGQFYLLDASTDRGIDTVRGTLKRLASKPTIDGIPRLICLDEYNFTIDGQNAMRSLMQEYQNNVRFILITNYPETISDPIISRCPVKVVNPPSLQDAKIIVERIQKQQDFKISPDAIELLYKLTQGDIRKFIGQLQDACLISNYNVQVQHIQTVSVDLATAKSILEAAQVNYDQAREVVITSYSKTKNAKDLLEKLYEATYITKFSDVVPDNEIIQRRLRERIAETDYRLTCGTNQLLQLDSLINYIRLLKFIPLNCPRGK